MYWVSKFVKLAVIVVTVGTVMINTGSSEEIIVSPNGRYGVLRVFDAPQQLEHVRIVSMPEKTELFSTGTIAVIGMRWSKDSKHLLVFDHIAGGSYLKVITVIGGKWTKIECDPPLKDFENVNVRYALISVSDLAGAFKIRYLVGLRSGKKSYILEYDLDVLNNKITNYKKSEVSSKKIASIRVIGGLESVDK